MMQLGGNQNFDDSSDTSRMVIIIRKSEIWKIWSQRLGRDFWDHGKNCLGHKGNCIIGKQYLNFDFHNKFPKTYGGI